MSKKTLFLLWVVSFIAAPWMTMAQDPSAEFEGMVEVTEVLLDVVAVDSSGDAVRGLGKDDFIVLENGEPVDLSGVSYYTTRYDPNGEIVVEDGDVPSSRYFIFFFHDQLRTGSSIGNRLVRQQLDASRQSRRWVEEQMLPSDWVAVVSYDVKLKVQIDYSQDRYQILEAIDNAARNRDPEKNVGRQGRRLPPSGAPSLLRHLPQGKELRKETKRIYDGIRLVADASAYIVGRKNMLMFTIGFGEFRNGTPFPTGDPRFYPPMEQALNDANVAVYTIDLTPTEFDHAQREFMSELATDTGGYYYGTFLNFITPLTEIAAENVGYYVLSYQSEHPAAESGYQKVKVKARDKKIKVRARKGYLYGSSGDA